jgi:transcriptional regulator with GAF, ATPase, and Fis domain
MLATAPGEVQMDWSVWYTSVGSEERSRAHAALFALPQLGIHPEPLARHAKCGPGILFLTARTPGLSRQIFELSRAGRDRVLIVADDESILGDDAWDLLHAGASDVMVWTELTDPSTTIAARLERWRIVDDLLASPEVQQTLVGSSPAWVSTSRQVVEGARFTDAPVLLLGETGTGKELIAQLIHTLDEQRSQQELVVVDCTTIVPELAGSELFGHERGAFTSAISARDGAFAVASGGTLFLDEVGELPSALQPQLLRAVQEKTYKRVGSNTWRHTDFRLICATNRDLQEDESNGQFRRDLYYRIAGWVISLPPLRERPDDIVPLTEHFIQQMRSGQEPPELSPHVRDYLLTRDYPGNVRDLRKLVARIVCRHVGSGPITIGDIPEDERIAARAPIAVWPDQSFDCTVRMALARGAGLREIRRLAEDAAIRVVTMDEQGNLQRAAKRLGVTDRALQVRKANHSQSDNNGSTPQTG